MRISLVALTLSLPLLLSARAGAQVETQADSDAPESAESPPNEEEVRERKLTRAPRLLVESIPDYPPDVPEQIDATVVLVLTIDRAGSVVDARVSGAPQPGFDEAAVRAARALLFSPAEVDGKPAAVRVKFRYDFTAQKPAASKESAPPRKSEVGRPERSDSSAEDVVEEVVIRGEDRSRIGVAELRPSEGEKVAGSVGDALNAVQSLPGVSAAPNGSGDISIWGATPLETRVYIDGVPVPALYHRGGYRSVIHDGLVERVTMIPAAFGPEHGRALGGMVQIETKRTEGERTHGQLGADFIGAQGLVHTEPAPSFGAMGAARVGYLDVLLPQIDPEVEQVVPLSAYRDYAAKVRLGSNPARYTEMSAFGAFDAVERRQPTSDPQSPSNERTREFFHRLTVRSFRGSSAHEDRWGIWLGFDRSELESNFSDVGTMSTTRDYRYGGNASRSIFVTESLTFTVGAELEGQHTISERQGTLGLPAREGDVVAFGQSPATQVGFDRWTTDILGLALFSGADLRFLANQLTVSPSLRLEPIVQMGDELVPASNTPAVGYSELDLAVSPRLAVKAEPFERLNLQAAAGLVHQPAPPADRSAVFGGTELGLSHAVHGLVGVVYEIQPATSIELTGFSKYGWDLVVRNPVVPPPVAAALVNGGASRNYGGQIILRGKPHALVSGWMTYTLSKAERRQSASSPWRPSDFDQRHLFTAVLSVQLSESWNIGARARAASGLPRTKVTGAYYDARLDAYQPLFGEHNRDPLPLTFQLDLHAEWARRFAWSELTFYLDVVNVTNQKNAIERTYNYDYSQTGYLTSLPILAVLGGKWEF